MLATKFVSVQQIFQLPAIIATNEMWPVGPLLKQVLQSSSPVLPVHHEKAATFQNLIFRCVQDRSRWRVQLLVLSEQKLFSSFLDKKIQHKIH